MNKQITRNWRLIDMDGKILGREATKIATYLQGKYKSDWKPNLDTGDYVVVVNVENLKVTGKKLDQKFYYKHTGYIGNLKQQSLKQKMEKNPADVLIIAVKGMLPKNKQSEQIIKRLKVYSGKEHPHVNIKFSE